jgi:hypothetical protein
MTDMVRAQSDPVTRCELADLLRTMADSLDPPEPDVPDPIDPPSQVETCEAYDRLTKPLPRFILPPEDAIYQRIDNAPRHPQSATMTQAMFWHPSFQTRVEPGPVFNVVSNCRAVRVTIGVNQLGPDEAWPEGFARDESYQGPFLVPSDILVQGRDAYFEIPANGPWTYQGSPRGTLLTDVQRGVVDLAGDRHAIVYDPATGLLDEFFKLVLTVNGWYAAYATRWDTRQTIADNGRAPGQNSGDAAGLPILPLLLRHDEIVSGEVTHAIRMTLPRVIMQKGYVPPANHVVETYTTDPRFPQLGQRFRLKADWPIHPAMPEYARTVVTAMQRYGLILADIGGPYLAPVCTPDTDFVLLTTWLWDIRPTDLEVVS